MKPKRPSFKVQSDFSSDRPIGSARADKLGRQEFAKGLAKRIAGWHGKDSLVVALCGEWGCGKTSLKNLIVEDLTRGKSAKVSVLEFNPWQVSGHGSLSATFFRELAIDLGHKSAQSHVPKGLVSKLKAYAKVALLAGTAAKWVGKAIGGGGEESGVAVELAGEALSHSAEAARQGAEAQEARNQEQEESLTDLKRSLSAGMEELVQPVLVVIDDIDRLTSDEIREVFQLVKANADFPNLVFLLMFDREIVCTALDAISGGRGHNFLDKIVQVLFHVPQPSLKAVHKVLFDALDAFLSESGVGERWEPTAYPTLITGIGALLEQSRRAVVRPILHTLSAKSSVAIFQTVSGQSPTREILSTVSIESLEGLPIAQTVSAKCSTRIFQTPSEKYATALRKFVAQDWCCAFVALADRRDSKVSLVTSTATC